METIGRASWLLGLSSLTDQGFRLGLGFSCLSFSLSRITSTIFLHPQLYLT